MRVDIGETETEQHMRNKKSTKALLAGLHHHHDARMAIPANYKKPKRMPKPEPIEDIKYPLVSDILKTVAKYYNVSALDIVSERRKKAVVFPRHMGMYLSRTLTLRSHPFISKTFGNRDHTVSIYACDKIEKLAQSDWQIAYDVAHLEAQFQQ